MNNGVQDENTGSNPIAGNGTAQPSRPKIQDVSPPAQVEPKQAPEESVDIPIQPEIVNDLPVKIQNTPLSQTQPGKDVPVSNPSTLPPKPVDQEDKTLEKVLKDVNRQIKADDNKPPKLSVFKRWELVIVTIIALSFAVALCLAAISAFKK